MVVQVPGVAQAGTLLRIVGTIADEPPPQEATHLTAIELELVGTLKHVGVSLPQINQVGPRGE